MSHQEALTAYTAAFVAELVQTGITDVVVSPGSRSTPMAMVMAEHPDLQLHILVDERSAAFFALGLAKASERPVAMLCTSGTAAANYYPAIVEAFYSRVPLLVLTADRPHELRDVGAPQAIDQIQLYGQHVKWFVEMALPESSNDMLRYVRTVGARASAVARQAPAGPVHLNFPFREPLVPKLDENLFALTERPDHYVKIHNSELSIAQDELNSIAQTVNRIEKGIIVCGQLSDESFADAVTALAAKLNFPIIADPLSQLRSGMHPQDRIIDAYDSFLRDDDAKGFLKPDVVIRFGAMPVSKALTIFLKENHQAVQYVVDGGGGWRDPAVLSTDMIYCNETQFCQQIAEYIEPRTSNRFFKSWKEANRLTKESLKMVNDFSTFNESRMFYELTDLLPEHATLFVGNSMPIRDVDSFFLNNNKKIKILANRGVNGIDGTISTALGASVHSKPLYLLIGDLTFYHDLNGLLPAKLYNMDVTVILINNNGGGIFSFLPQAEHPKNFELLFGTPLNLEFEHVVRMYGGKFISISDLGSFQAAMEASQNTPGLNVIEVVTDREMNTAEHREIWSAVSREISKFVKGDA